MKHVLPVLVLLLLFAALVSAAPVDDAQYITVVRASDGALGVIAAANFAAAMQVHGARFTGALRADLAAVRGLDQKFLVFFDGKHATIVDGKGDPTTAADARAWLEEQNYTVDVSTLAAMVPELATTPGPSPAATTAPPSPTRAPAKTVPCNGCRYGDQCLAPGTRTATQYCAGTELRPLKANGEACVSDEECDAGACENGTCGAPTEDRQAPPLPAAPAPRKNFFARLVNWLFGWL